MIIAMKWDRRIWGGVLFGILVYMLMSVYADFDSLRSTITHFNAWFLAPLFFLTTVTILLRFIRWEVFIRRIGIHLYLKDSIFIFVSGIPMTLTPGKTGEIWKAWLIKDRNGEDLSRTIPVVIVERIADVIGAIVLVLTGLAYYQQSIYFILVLILLIGSVFSVIRSRKISRLIISITEKRAAKHTDNLRIIHQTFEILLRWRLLASMSLLAALGWFLECLALYFVILGFEESSSITLSTFAFTFSSLVGGFSMLPGGLGVADAGISSLLGASGIPTATAVGTAIIVRLGTLWYPVCLGLLVYFVFRGKFMARARMYGPDIP